VKDYYDILGVEETADAEAIKKAYRRLARKYHPDRNPGDASAEEHFKAVQEAYDVLSDQEARRKYDRLRRDPFAGGGGEHTTSGGARYYRSPDGTYVRFEDGGSADDSDPLGGLGDLFSRMFGAEPQATRPRRPEPAREVTVEIAFEDMLRGGKVNIALPDGRSVEIPYPPGVRDGYRIRIRSRSKGAGHYVRFRVRPHESFRHEGSDLFTVLRVNAFEAMLGAGRSIMTPYGTTLKVTVPKGTQPGDRLRLRGQGIRAGDSAGDLIVELVVTVPKDLGSGDEEAIRQAAKKAGLL
jgi:DnaJ-class molecular chaperone